MVEKFGESKDAFAELFRDGATYEQISRELGISEATANEWRKRLHFAPRGINVQSSWMDQRKIGGISAREVLKNIAEPLGLFPKEIELILLRFDKLRDKKLTAGRRRIEVILAGAYLYLRWKGSNRVPISAYDFVRLCNNNGFQLSRKRLLTIARLYMSANLFPSDFLTARETLEKKWISLQEEFKLNDSTKRLALALASHSSCVGKSPESAASACFYLACKASGLFVTEKHVAKEFGVTEVTVRNSLRAISEALSAEIRSILKSSEEPDQANTERETSPGNPSPEVDQTIQSTQVGPD